MIDFTKSNKWKNFKNDRRLNPVDHKLMDYIELLESQIIALEAVVYALKKKVETNEEESHG